MIQGTHSGRAIRLAIFAIAAFSFSASCSAQDNTTHSAPIVIRAGQGGFVTMPDTTPSPTVYALTGEPSAFAQTAKAWQHDAGPVLSVGNGRIVVPGR